MPRINIVERDETLTTTSERLYNVVYVPGFSINASFPAKTPTTFTSYSTFKAAVGSSAAVFATDIRYDSCGTWASGSHSSELMFKEGDSDPSYMYAAELLKQGIPVVYERVNNSTSEVAGTYGPTVETTDHPADPEDVGFSYATLDPWGKRDGELDVTYEARIKTFLETAPTKSWTDTSTYPAEADELCKENGAWFINIAPNTSAQEVGDPSYVFSLWKYQGEGIWKRAWNNYDVTITAPTELAAGNPTLLTIYGFSVAELYSYLDSSRFEKTADNVLYDRNLFQIKYLTTGGYPVFEFNDNSIISKMQALANPNEVVTSEDPVVGRGDCIVLVDHTNYPERPLIGVGSVIAAVQASPLIATDYTAMFSPWFYYGSVPMPGSFAYLISLAESVKANPNWLAIAGVNRGVVPGATSLAITGKMTRAIADSYMTWGTSTGGSSERSIFINPITSVRPYGLTIWGNRTLAKTTVNSDKALYYLNMRSLVAEIKKSCYVAAEQLMFEQNSDVLWINFKSKIVPLLDQMASSYGISGYKIIKEAPDNKHQLKATIKIFPIYAVEDFDITIILTNDDEVIVEE